jgi:hypothetical protein
MNAILVRLLSNERASGGVYELVDHLGYLYSSKVAPKHIKYVSDAKIPEDHFEVEKILNHRGTPTKRQYLVRCKGYAPEHDSWANVEDISVERFINKIFMFYSYFLEVDLLSVSTSAIIIAIL